METPLNPIVEMGRYIRGSINIARAKRRFAELLGWEAAEDIQADVVAHEKQIAAKTYSAEQGDLEAIKLLETAAADGFKNADLPAVAKAIRLIRRSAELDHDASDLATIP